MGLFNKKLSLDDILAALNNLSDEEKAQVKEKLNESTPVEETANVEMEESTIDNEQEGEPQPEESEVTEEVGEESGEEPVVDNVGNEIEKAPPVEETVEPAPEEPSQEPQEVAEEQTPEVQEQAKELDDAQTAKIHAIEEKLALVEEKLEQVLSLVENKDFGLEPAVPEGGGEDHKRMSAVMRGYAGGNANKYL